jgi:hypothetical protein
MTIIYKRFEPGEIDALRAELIAASGLDLETLRERMETWQVSPEQAAIFRRLEQLDWLEEGR